MTAIRRNYGMPETLLRHGLIVLLSAGAVVAQGGTLSVSVFSQPWSWLAVAVVLGVLSAIVGRGLIGTVFLLIGFGVGIETLLVTHFGAADGARSALARDGYLYAAMLAAAVEAYLVVLLLRVRLRRR